jgi:hypothetical protein
MVYGFEDVWESSEESEEDREIECYVEGEEADCWLSDEHVKRPDESDGHEEL